MVCSATLHGPLIIVQAHIDKAQDVYHLITIYMLVSDVWTGVLPQQASFAEMQGSFRCLTSTKGQMPESLGENSMQCLRRPMRRKAKILNLNIVDITYAGLRY